MNFVSRTTETIDFDEFVAGACQTHTLSSGNLAIRGNDVAMVSPPTTFPDAVSFHTENTSTGGLFGTSSLILVACAHAAVADPASAIFDVVTFQ